MKKFLDCLEFIECEISNFKIFERGTLSVLRLDEKQRFDLEFFKEFEFDIKKGRILFLWAVRKKLHK